ncbi:MAG: hypothetical protein E6J34_11510 [Chloroflexi bacterium]|nr:MAG: hypothetical protein E6J34_11510 [Chloroflexota bacterium]
MKLAKALEKRIKTPYGKDNIRIERSEDKHTKAKVWRVVRVVAGSLFYATRGQNEFFSASDGREKEEENKNDGEKKNMFEIEEERTDYPQLPANNDPQLPANEEAPKQIGSTGQSTHAGSPNEFAGSPNEQRTIFDDTEGLPEEEYDEVLI